MLKLFKRWSIVIFLMLILIEYVFFFSWENLFGCFVMLYGWIIISCFILRQSVLVRHPAIFLVSLGLGVFYYYFPLIGTLLAFRPLTYQFHFPYEVFVHQLIYVTVYVLAFLLYFKSNFRPKIFRQVLKRFKVYHTPTDLQLWIMGWLGVVVFLYMKIVVGISQMDAESVSPLVKFLTPIIQFVYAPILLQFKGLYSVKAKKRQSSNPLIYVYIIGLVTMSFLANDRQFMVSSILLLILLYLFDAVLRCQTIKKAFPFKRILLFTLLAFVIAGPITKMATAMLMVRNIRNEISAIELFKTTIDAYNSPEIDEKMEIIEAVQRNNFEWSEDYTGNVLFDRLCNLRIADMTIYFTQMADMETTQALQDVRDKLIAQLPSPILHKLGFNIDKIDSHVTYTVSSIARVQSTGYGSGGKSVAAHTGTGMWLFGSWYPLFFIIIYFFLFFIIDSFVIKVGYKYRYSVLFLINIYFFFTFLNFKNGIISDLLFMFRPYIQMCFIYVLIFYLTRLVSGLIRKT